MKCDAKKLIGNKEHLPEDQKEYILDKKGNKKAILIHVLGNDDCPKCWQELDNHFTDGNKVYRKVID